MIRYGKINKLVFVHVSFLEWSKMKFVDSWYLSCTANNIKYLCKVETIEICIHKEK